MNKHTLSAQKRTLVGRKVKQLRRAGQIPASVYGKGIQSAAVTVGQDAFETVYKQTGETGLIELSVDGQLRPVLVHTVQKDPVSGAILHIEFFQVNLKEKVHAKVPVVVTGEAPAVAQKLGVLLTVLDEIEVEALPAELPEHIPVDVSSLAAVDQELKVSDLAVVAGVTVVTDGTLTVVKVGPLVSKEAQVQAAAEEAAAAAQKAESVEGGEAAAAPAPEAVTPEQPAPETSEKKAA